MPHTALACQVSKMINSDTCPRPTTQDLARALRRALAPGAVEETGHSATKGLRGSATKAYQAWLGYYNSNTRRAV